MNKSIYSTAITDALFVLLPFLVLFVIKFMQSNISEMLKLSDYSLATSIMYCQLLGKTLFISESKKKDGNFQLFQVVVFILSILSIVFYASFQLVLKIPLTAYIIQLAFFITSILLYIPLLTLINKMSEK
ncbi:MULTISPECIES: hypothetical protein [Enterobacterales]|uniref:hypothetical protein n=1 Tax=Enterobacterales TaxID=91347 RepID=UPI0011A151CB|nr:MULTISPECIES: hypothetical protein [Enterobacterales]MEB0949530.1 hypothetical protein [Citrobacter sedlakii]